MSLRLDNYQSSGTTGVANWFIGLGYADRNLPRDPGLPSPYFLSMHHWVCFQSQYPVTSSYFLQPDKAQLAFQLMLTKNKSADFADIVKPVRDELPTRC